MARIIAGNFATLEEVELVRLAIEAVVGTDRVGTFHLNSPGQHDRYPIGGDQDKDPGTVEAANSSVSGAAVGAIVGAAVGAVVGPLGVVAGAATGAYTGAFVGGLQRMERDNSKQLGDQPIRPAGVMLAVRTDGLQSEQAVIDAMRSAGARVIEHAEGDWRDRDWVDFDPVSRPKVMYLRPPHD